jgi:hypothetical protein
MKNCPTCYAIMRESIRPTQIPELQHKPIDGTPGVSAARTDMSVANVVTRKNHLPNPLRLRNVDDPF